VCVDVLSYQINCNVFTAAHDDDVITTSVGSLGQEVSTPQGMLL